MNVQQKKNKVMADIILIVRLNVLMCLLSVYCGFLQTGTPDRLSKYEAIKSYSHMICQPITAVFLDAIAGSLLLFISKNTMVLPVKHYTKLFYYAMAASRIFLSTFPPFLL
jgi:hypothetical protein